MHFLDRGVSDAKSPPSIKHTTEEGVGICRRSPPRLFLDDDEGVFSGFPRIHRLHSCGEWSTEVPL